VRADAPRDDQAADLVLEGGAGILVVEHEEAAHGEALRDDRGEVAWRAGRFAGRSVAPEKTGKADERRSRESLFFEGGRGRVLP
jgi:hypothetical protein